MKTLKELKNRPTVIHSFETRDLGRIDLLIYEGNHVWQNKMRRIWMPQLYIFSDDMMADFKGANTSRWDSYPRTIRDDVRDWDAACLKNSVQYKVGDWEASWVRQFNVLDILTSASLCCIILARFAPPTDSTLSTLGWNYSRSKRSRSPVLWARPAP